MSAIGKLASLPECLEVGWKADLSYVNVARVKSGVCHLTVLVTMFTLLAACDGRERKVSEEDIHLIRETLPGVSEECLEKVRYGGLDAFPRQVERCFKMTPARQWRGLWRNEFEESQFCPEPARDCGFDTPGDFVWLSFSEPLDQQMGERGEGLYEVEFIGRQTAARGQHGHLGSADHHMVVDRLVSIRPSGARESPTR